jgi:hypothetical protein
MTAISGASGLSMGSLYALLGQAMSSGVSSATADRSAPNPALAMIAASNASAGMEVMTLLGSMGGAASTAPAADQAAFQAASLSQAFASLSYLDPAKELALMGVDVPTTSTEASSG